MISHPSAEPVVIVEGPASRLRFAARVAGYLLGRRGRTDFVLVQGYGLAALAANLVCWLLTIPAAMLICSPVEDYYRCRRSNPLPGKPYSPFLLWGLMALARLNALFDHCYVTLSEHLSEIVRSHGGRQIEQIPVYGVNTDVFKPDGDKNKIRLRLGLPTSGTVIFFSSRIAPEKDSRSLLSAVRTLRQRGYDVWILHRSGGFQSFMREAESLGVADRVNALDAVHPHFELPDLYRASDICVQASRAEGLGFSPLEALACQVPVIATAVGGLKETVVEPDTGWTYEVGDPSALANKIEEVINNPAEAADRARRGRAMVISRYDQAMVFDRLRRMVERLTATSSRND